MNYLVLDLETIRGEVPHDPRPSELAQMLGALYKSVYLDPIHPLVLAAGTMLVNKEESFPPPACWKIACAACVLLQENGQVERFGIVKGGTEKDVIRALAGLLEEKSTTLVTWNGRRFDVPVVEARCLHYGISIPTFSRSWRYRYGESAHYDLKDYVSGFGAAPSVSLDQASRLVGLPGKPEDVDGSKVGAMIAEGRLLDVQAYCLSDALQTAGVLLRTEIMRGKISLEDGRRACATLLEKMSADERVRWIAEKTDRRVFLMEEP